MQGNSANLNVPITHIQDQSGFGLTVDVVVFGYDGQLKVLALRSDMRPFHGLPSIFGDVIHRNELLKDAANRILEKYTGLNNIPLKQLGAFDQLDRHPLKRVITIGYYTVIDLVSNKINVDLGENLEWLPYSELGDMAFDHRFITQNAVHRLRTTLDRSLLDFDILPKYFTLTDLQRIYEVILDTPLDKRNFRKKVMNQGYIESTGKLQTNVSHRPAELYALKSPKSKKTA